MADPVQESAIVQAERAKASAIMEEARAIGNKLGEGLPIGSRGIESGARYAGSSHQGISIGQPFMTSHGPKPATLPTVEPVDSVCLNKAEQPTIFLVDNFLHGDKAKSEAGRFSDYPPVVKREFSETLEASLALIQIKSATASAGYPSRLFKINNIRSVNDLPNFLRSGDIVLTFIHSSLYAVGSDGEFEGRVNLDTLDVEADILFERFEQAIRAHWRNVATTPPPSIVRSQIDPDKIGISNFLQDVATLPLSKGGTQNIYYSIRIGVVDVGEIAGSALSVFEADIEANDRRNAMRALRRTKPEFGPLAVFAVKRGKYFEAVGRLLAYALLHELWHSALLTPGHPYGMSPNIIEGSLPAFDYVPLNKRL